MKLYILTVMLMSLIVTSACNHPKWNGEQNTDMQEDVSKRPCVSDADCEKGYSCWYKIPRGPSPGIRGSEQNPGTCWSNDVIIHTE